MKLDDIFSAIRNKTTIALKDAWRIQYTEEDVALNKEAVRRMDICMEKCSPEGVLKTCPVCNCVLALKVYSTGNCPKDLWNGEGK